MSNLFRIFITGGVIRPKKLFLLLKCLKDNNIPRFHLGSRQDILFKAPIKALEDIKTRLDSNNVHYELDGVYYKNISSSVLSTSIEDTNKWADWNKFDSILTSFDFLPRIRINVADPNQNLTPLFSGNINFIASERENLWYVYLRFSNLGTEVYHVPYLVTSEQIPAYSKNVDTCVKSIEQIKSYEEIITTLNWKSELKCKEKKSQEFLNKGNYIPNYEGLNRDKKNDYWLGLYFRKNMHNVNIFYSIVKKCLEDNESVFGITSWKSIIIFNIKEKKCNSWIKLMGEWGMNLRHSTLDLNWYLPAIDENAYNLKKEIVKTLDENDISIQGLSFSIIMEKKVDYIFTNVIIKKINEVNGKQFFDVLYTENFVLNTEDYNYFAKTVLRKNLPLVLVELSHFYFQTMKA